MSNDKPMWKLIPRPVFVKHLSGEQGDKPQMSDEFFEPIPVDISDALEFDENTFFITVRYANIPDAKIFPPCRLIVNRKKKPLSGKTVVYEVAPGVLALKMYQQYGNYIQIIPADPRIPEYASTPDDKYEIWGVVMWTINEP